MPWVFLIGNLNAALVTAKEKKIANKHSSDKPLHCLPLEVMIPVFPAGGQTIKKNKT